MRAVVSGLVIAAALASAAFAEGGGRWGARDPVTECVQVTTPEGPAIDQVVALVRCRNETITRYDELWLLEDLKLQIGAARAHQGYDEYINMPDADTSKPVHDLRGSWISVMCRIPSGVAATGGDPSRNCTHQVVTAGKGACWMTSFGDWQCNVSGSGERSDGHPPPQ